METKLCQLPGAMWMCVSVSQSLCMRTSVRNEEYDVHLWERGLRIGSGMFVRAHAYTRACGRFGSTGMWGAGGRPHMQGS